MSDPVIPPTPKPILLEYTTFTEEDPSASTTNRQPLSKNAQKRLVKAQRREENKAQRKARDKARKVARKQMIADKRSKGEMEESHAEDDGGSARKKRKLDPKVFGAKIVIDLGFDEKMTEREIISLVSQCAYCYSLNRQSPNPFSNVLFTSLNGRTRARLDMLKTYASWKGVEWWEDDYENLWSPLPSSRNEADEPAITDVQRKCPVTGQLREPTRTEKESVVYLTADSDAELTELNSSETYIIGGLVDKNRYKALCETKASSQSIRTARLPIGAYLANLPTRKVLTINQVFDILLQWVTSRDWEKAFAEVIPARKFDENRKSKRLKGKQLETDCERKDENRNGSTEDSLKENDELDR